MRRIFARLPMQIEPDLISRYLATSRIKINGKRRSILVSPKAYEKLQKMAHSENISMSSTLLLSAIDMLLSQIESLKAEREAIARTQTTVKDVINSYQAILSQKDEEINHFKRLYKR